MNINNLGLLNSLSFIMNEGIKDSDYAITVYIVNNLYRINDITINMIIDESYTSRSAVRRFCNRLGYDNFSDFKASITQLIFPSNLRHREFKSLEDHREHLNMLLLEIIKDINLTFSDNQINQIVEKIHKSEKVILLCANNTSGDLIKFQQELIYANKVINIVSNAYTNNRIVKDLDSHSLIITVSASGKFAEIANSWIKEMYGEKLLITANRDPLFTPIYDEIFHISQASFSNDYLGIYGKYGIVYIFDLISASYLYQYAHNKT